MGTIDLNKGLEQLGSFLGGYPGAVVHDFEAEVFTLFAELQANMSLGCEFDGVGQQVDEYLGDTGCITCK